MQRTNSTPIRLPFRSGRNRGWHPQRSEDGAIAVMAVFVILLMIAMFGFALDLSRAYNRKVELQNVADIAALAAANVLDGTPGGIDRATKAANDAAVTFSFAYNSAAVSWAPGALAFGMVPNSGHDGWVDGNSAKASAGKFYFARVDTSLLEPIHGRIKNLLIPILSSEFAETKVTATAVAGRDSLNALPLAICANSNTPASSLPSGELVEYGFRRGVSYDLMNINPAGGAPENFLVNPIAPAGTSGISMMGSLDIIAAYVCTGKMAIPSLQGGEVTVERGFPISSLYQQLNSRFGTYATPCQPTSAPADPNATSFVLAGASWIKSQPPGLSVGPLWSYAKAAKYASYTTSKGLEPAGGYATFTASKADWATLYPGPPAAEPQSYPATTPYQSTGGISAYKTPYNTRVLRIPLLQCPVPSGSSAKATVTGIGKFFMTVPASSSAIHAEFAGMESWTNINGNARLY